jgi:Fe-S-cluster-containing hydrogenase component 2/CRP-like cAMP-binding protein
MVRNAFAALRKSEAYRSQLNAVYRERMMETQIRSLPLFQVLTDDEYTWLADKVDLVEFASSEVIFDQHDASNDFCYVIRTGFVKASCDLGILLAKDEVPSLSDLARELQMANESPLGSMVWNELPEETRSTIQQLAASNTDASDTANRVRSAVNAWIQGSQICRNLGKTSFKVIEYAGLQDSGTPLSLFTEKTEDWSPLETRVFNRIFLEKICPESMPRRSAITFSKRTIAYHTRGEFIGGQAILERAEHDTTCEAYSHPLAGQKVVPQQLEAVRISSETLKELQRRSERFRQAVDEEVRKRVGDVQNRDDFERRSNTVSTREFESLGLAWGDELLLVDLDRCTRCQECVKACVASHDDGRSRLYLDGPRAGKYLIPLTCRKCVDPVCMIGCPVGAINRGSNGEIRITDWCIGCSKCADQCPYGSIQMDLISESHTVYEDVLGLFSPSLKTKSIVEKAVVCDLCTLTPSQDPACVYACPHDAAVRVTPLEEFDGIVS